MDYRLFDFIIASIFIVIQLSLYIRVIWYLQGIKTYPESHPTYLNYIVNLYYIFFAYSILSIILISLHPYFIYLSHTANILFIIGTLYILDKLPKSIDREILFILAIIYAILYFLLIIYYLMNITSTNSTTLY